MMKKLCLSVIFVCFFAQISLGQEIFLRNDKYFSELYLKLDTAQITSVNKGNAQVDIYFAKKLKTPFTKNFDDRFLTYVHAEGGKLTVYLNPQAEFTVVNDVSGLKIVASAKKTNSDILSSYGIGSPMLSVDSSEDKAQEEALNNADSLIASKRFADGAAELSNIIKNTTNDFYRQEAFYKLGQTYLLMAQYDDQYLTEAYTAFDDFVRLYPDNFRATDAMLKSAEAKEKANQLFEAAFTYEKIYDTTSDLDTKRYALIKMAELYVTVGQLDKAIDMYHSYLKNFRTDKDEINARIGQLYYDRREMNLAYEYFSVLDIDSIINNPSTDAQRLYSIARNMEVKNKPDTALKLYTALYEKFPQSSLVNDAIFGSAAILEKTGRTIEADKLLLKLKESFPDKITGQKAAVEYARKYLSSKPYSYWSKFFEDLLSRHDDFGLHHEAKYMLLKSLYSENNIDELIKGASSYLGMYPDSPYKDEVDKMRMDFMFSQSSNAFNQGDLIKAEPLLVNFMGEYPNSPYNPRVTGMLQDIKFDKANQKYKDNQYDAVISAAENHIAQNPESKELARWFDLLDNALYKDLSIIYASQDWAASRVAARQYLTSYPKGRHVKTVKEILEEAVSTPMEVLYKNSDYNGVIRMYEANKDWTEAWQNRAFKDRLSVLTGLSLCRLGLFDKAKPLYSSVVPSSDKDYAVLGILLGDKSKTFDVNAFDEETLRYVIGETEQTDPDMAVALLKQYTKDLKLAASLEYGIAKNIPQDAKRQELLMDVYSMVSSNPSARFEGSQEVYLDMGLLYYRKNDFQGAVIPLKEFADIHKEKDDKRAEALYYLGKSFINMSDAQRGFLYYNEIIETMPKSIYAGIAKSELDEDSWKKNLNRF